MPCIFSLCHALNLLLYKSCYYIRHDLYGSGIKQYNRDRYTTAVFIVHYPGMTDSQPATRPYTRMPLTQLVRACKDDTAVELMSFIYWK